MIKHLKIRIIVGRCLRILFFSVLAMLCTHLQADGPKLEFGSIPCVDVLSDVFGFGALVSINNDHELRRKLEITDQQLSDIRMTFESQSLNKGDKVATEAAAQAYLKKVLTEVQADKLRRTYVKVRFRSPARFFEPFILRELGVEPKQAKKITSALHLQLEEVNQKLDKLIIQAISDAFPPESQDILWSFVGSNFQINANGSDWRKISVLSVSNSIGQLTLGTLISMPNELVLSNQQCVRMNNLLDELSAKGLTGNRSSEVEVSRRLDDILTNQQRFAIVQKIQQGMIRRNLSLAVGPEMVKHFNLSDDNISLIKAELEEAKKQVSEVESICLLEASKKVLGMAPSKVKDDILRLADGIWDLK